MAILMYLDSAALNITGIICAEVTSAIVKRANKLAEQTYIINTRLIKKLIHEYEFDEFCIVETACLTMRIFLSFCALTFISKIPQQGVCTEQAFFRKNEQKYLANHVIVRKQAESESECGLYCVADGSCASVNYKISGIDKGRCELNNSTLQEAPDEETHHREFTYLVFIEQVCKTICDGYYMYITYQFLVRSESLAIRKLGPSLSIFKS